MLKKAKWVKTERADEPVSAIAADAVRERLDVVWHYLSLAAARWEDDVEFVHQLRVGTRRAAAATNIFADVLPGKRSNRMRKRLRHIRRSAGEARDLDVLADRLRFEVEKRGRDALGVTLDRIAQLRLEAQEPIQQIYKRMSKKGFPDEIQALCKRIRWRGSSPEPTYAQTARRLLHREAEDFFAAAEEDLTITENLHALRIQGKQLRYAMELLAGAFGRWMRDDVYPKVRELQDKLGQINDHAVARCRFLHWAELSESPPTADQFNSLAAEEQQQVDQSKSEFLSWWNNQRREELEQKFRALTAPD